MTAAMEAMIERGVSNCISEAYGKSALEIRTYLVRPLPFRLHFFSKSQLRQSHYVFRAYEDRNGLNPREPCKQCEFSVSRYEYLKETRKCVF